MIAYLKLRVKHFYLCIKTNKNIKEEYKLSNVILKTLLLTEINNIPCENNLTKKNVIKVMIKEKILMSEFYGYRKKKKIERDKKNNETKD